MNRATSNVIATAETVDRNLTSILETFRRNACPKALLLGLGLLLFLPVDSLMGQVETRTEQIQASRRHKMTRLLERDRVAHHSAGQCYGRARATGRSRVGQGR